MYEVIDEQGTKRGTVTYAEDAAALVALTGGTIVSLSTGRVVWTQGTGKDGDAGDSYDETAEVMHAREQTQRHAAKGRGPRNTEVYPNGASD